MQPPTAAPLTILDLAKQLDKLARYVIENMAHPSATGRINLRDIPGIVELLELINFKFQVIDAFNGAAEESSRGSWMKRLLTWGIWQHEPIRIVKPWHA
jgi:hypothetical protein